MRPLLYSLSLLAALAARAVAQVPTEIRVDVPYVTGGDERQQLDLYLPQDGAAAHPLVVWIHGGGWAMGDRKQIPTVPFTQHGFAFASIGYRLSQQAPFPAQIEDCKAAIRWLRAHAPELGIDPSRIGVWGASAGGHLAALLGTSGGDLTFDLGENLEASSRVQAVVDWCGPTDFARFFPQPMPDAHHALVRMFTQLLAGPIDRRAGLIERANPVAYVTPDDPPFLIMHGTADSIVPYSQSQLLADALAAVRVPVTFRPVVGGQHVFSTPQTQAAVLAFFQRTLQPTP